MTGNKYGICEWSLPAAGPFALRLAAETGFDGIQLGDLGGGPLNFPLNHPRMQQGYLEEAEKSGVRLHSLHLHTLVREGTMRYPLASPEGERAARSIQKGIEACKAMRIDRLMLSSFFASEIRHAYDFNNFADMLSYACDLGAENGVRIVYEGILPIERLLRLLDIVGDRLTVLYDTLNPIRFGSGDPQEEIRRIGVDRIDHIHVKDAPHEMVGCCLLGTGEGRFAQTAKLLNDLGYAGWYITENYYAQPPMGENADPYELARMDLQTMRATFDRGKGD
ncbi:MAG: sugar phosphate isomerase/epimerase family protein [Eubacteriales bacterium]|nr:sugar phosphate isomerase/epimerase family protein [Eubacteriales bacterium]